MERGRDWAACVWTERVVGASVGAVFGAFREGSRLGRWWGPAGFRCTFERFEFEVGGRWVFVMHGPNGVDYHNECVFRAIGEAEGLIVVDHVVAPLFRLTVRLTEVEGGTHLRWEQEFESAEMAERMRVVCEGANEEVLDRLEREVAAGE